MSTLTATRTAPYPSTRRKATPQAPSDQLGRYTDEHGRRHEIVARPGANDSRLVIDRLAGTLEEPRLIAHLPADEPPQNARIVSELYLADTGGRYCRPLTVQDLTQDPLTAPGAASIEAFPQAGATGNHSLCDARGHTYRLQPRRSPGSIPELRWQHITPGEPTGEAEPVSVRHVIGALEAYEPVRTITSHGLAAYDGRRDVSVCVLRAELARLNASPILLNRGVREAVLAAVEPGRLSMSEIAIRCGRLKRDPNGNESGETSWLGRRIGVLPEGGKSTPTPWVSADVLALIARQGLGVAPREVEL